MENYTENQLLTTSNTTEALNETHNVDNSLTHSNETLNFDSTAFINTLSMGLWDYIFSNQEENHIPNDAVADEYIEHEHADIHVSEEDEHHYDLEAENMDNADHNHDITPELSNTISTTSSSLDENSRIITTTSLNQNNHTYETNNLTTPSFSPLVNSEVENMILGTLIIGEVLHELALRKGEVNVNNGTNNTEVAQTVSHAINNTQSIDRHTHNMNLTDFLNSTDLDHSTDFKNLLAKNIRDLPIYENLVLMHPFKLLQSEEEIRNTPTTLLYELMYAMVLTASNFGKQKEAYELYLRFYKFYHSYNISDYTLPYQDFLSDPKLVLLSETNHTSNGSISDNNTVSTNYSDQIRHFKYEKKRSLSNNSWWKRFLFDLIQEDMTIA